MKKTPNPIDKAVGARVRLRRMELGHSQGWLGDKLGLTFQQVQKYEKGANRIGSSRMVQIAEALEKPVAWFFAERSNGNAGDADIVMQMMVATGGMRLAKSFLAIKSQEGRRSVITVAQALEHAG
jgi:transcriptional regulator with XRE-family HTH domain